MNIPIISWIGKMKKVYAAGQELVDDTKGLYKEAKDVASLAVEIQEILQQYKPEAEKEFKEVIVAYRETEAAVRKFKEAFK